MKPFNLYFGKIQKAGSNVRLELKKNLREVLQHRGASLEPKSQIAITVVSGEEEGCIVAKLYFRKEKTNNDDQDNN